MRRLSSAFLVPLILCCAALLASACSMVSLGYATAPTLLAWRASRYFDLDSAQQAQLRARLEHVREWHRREELPRVIATLGDARRRADALVTPADAEWFVASVQEHYRVALGRVIDETVDLAASLGPPNVAALQRRLADEEDEFDEKWIDPPPDEIRRERYDRVLEDVEDWLGPLSRAQRQGLKTRLDALPLEYAAWQADRRRRQREFVALLQWQVRNGVRTVGAEDPFVAKLRRWALDWDRGRSPEELARVDRFVRDYCAIGVELANDASPAQRDHLRRRLATLIADLSRELR
jgi:uncharacterized protein DUF6279